MMDRHKDYTSASRRDLALQHYEYALVMFHDGCLQEALEAIEKACHLHPACEIYQETLAQFKMLCNFGHNDYEACTDFGQQYYDWSGLDGFQTKRSKQVNKANPSYCYDRGHSGLYQETTANHVCNGTKETPATPNGKSNKKENVKKSSPVDGLSHIELPSGNINVLRNFDKLENEQVVPATKTRSCTADINGCSTSCSSVTTNPWTLKDESDPENISEYSSRADETGARSSDSSREHFVNYYRDYVNNGGCGSASDETFEEKFLEQLCKAREVCDDGWDKYLELLNEICIDNSDTVVPEEDNPLSSSSRDFNGVDESDDRNSDRQPESIRKTNASTDSKIQSSNSGTNSTRTKCVQDYVRGTEKEGVYFVNGSCYSSSHPPRNRQPQTREHVPAKVVDEKQHIQRTEILSKSQKDFYKNLGKYYFGSGKVKCKNEIPKDKESRKDVSGSESNCKEKQSGDGGFTGSIGLGKVKCKNEIPKDKESRKDVNGSESNCKEKQSGDGGFTGSTGLGKVKCKNEIPKEKESRKDVNGSESNCTDKQSVDDGFTGSTRLGKCSQNVGLGVQSSQVQGEQYTGHPIPPVSKMEDCGPGNGGVNSKVNWSFANARNTGLEGPGESNVSKKEQKRSGTSDSVKTDQSSEAQGKSEVCGSQVQDKVHMPKGRRPTFPEQTGRRHKGRHRRNRAQGTAVSSHSVDQEKQEVSRKCGVSRETTELQSEQANIQNLQVWLKKSGKRFAVSCGQATLSVLQYVIILALLLAYGCIALPLSYVWRVVCRIYTTMAGKVKELLASLRNVVKTKTAPWFNWLKKFRRRRSQEAERIYLSMTRDEAVLKMISSKDKDPYCILGVSSEASEDDIRKHYKRLAVLTHPDKNDHPQADEAFKILADAFGQLGTPEKRMEYDMEEASRRNEQHFNKDKSDPRNFFFELHKQMKEMQNYLSCDACGGKHRRYETDRQVYAAMFCSRCSMRHGVKQGDLWAESILFGMKIYFYACIDHTVFDVTEWAACQGLLHRRIQTDTHTAPWKLKTRTSNSGRPFKSEEEQLDDFLREMFSGNHFPFGDEKPGTQNKTRKKKRKKRR